MCAVSSTSSGHWRRAHDGCWAHCRWLTSILAESSASSTIIDRGRVVDLTAAPADELRQPVVRVVMVRL
jgi:hypothetical protein